MQTPLQLLVNRAGIAAYDVRIEGGQGVGVKARHKADSPNYLFVDVKVKPDAEPGTYYLVFSQGERQFKVPYEIAARAEGSAARKSFTTADMIYLLMPDRFANGDASNDSTPHTRERADRSAFFGRHGGDLQGMIDHLDYIAGLGATAVWPTPLLLDDEPEGSYHGYACGDYYRIDPRFGSNELYGEFVGKSPRARAEGDYGHRHQPLRHGPLVDERPAFQGLDTPVPRIHRDERLLLDEHGSQRFALRP